MDRKVFYDHLRKPDSGVFGSSLSARQVEGMEAILDECERTGADLGQTAYILGTGYGESGHQMQPAYENLNYSVKRIPQVFSAERRQGIPAAKLARNPERLANTVYGGEWGRKNLGNTHHGDGWEFRGTGIGQITGRGQFEKWGANLGLPLVSQPELLMRLDVSVKALVCPMLEGWARGHRLDRYVKGARRDYHRARAVWNHPTSDPAAYARYARAFEAALEAAGYAPKPVSAPPETAPAPSAPTAPASGFWAALMTAILKLFRRT